MANKTSDKNENMHDYDVIKHKPVILSKKYKYFNKNIFFRIFTVLSILFIYIFFYIPVGKFYYRIKVKNKENYKKYKKGGYIMTCNHIHPMDAFFNGCIVFPHKMYITMLQTNLGIPFAGKLFRIAGGVPIPNDIELLSHFNDQMRECLDKRNTKILVYPEAALKPLCEHIRSFKNGAFRWAVEFNKPILPIVITYRKPKSKKRVKPYLTFNFLEPVYVVEKDTKYETINDLKLRVFNKTKEYFENMSEIKDNYEYGNQE